MKDVQLTLSITKAFNKNSEYRGSLYDSLADLGMCIPTDEDSKESKSAI